MPDPRDIFKHFFGGGGRDQDEDKQLIEVIQLPLEKIFRGCSIQHSYKRKVPCTKCEGTGSIDKISKTCSTCKGKKIVVQMNKIGFMVQHIQTACPACHGTGGDSIPDNQKCPACDSRGFDYNIEDITLNVPKGISKDNKIKINGKGHYKDGKYNPLYVVIQEIPHSRFQRGIGINDLCPPNPLNLLYTCECDILDVLVQKSLPIKFLDNKTYHVKLNIPDLNKCLCILPNMGMMDEKGARGDLFINIQLRNDILNTQLRNKIKKLLHYDDTDIRDVIDTIDMKHYRPSTFSQDHEEQRQCTQQ